MNSNEIQIAILRLKELANTPPIDEKKIDEAIRISEKNISTTKDLFVILCSLNLLNAAIKMSFYRDKLKYRFIKGHVTKIITYLLPKELQQKFCTRIYISNERVAYFEIMDFHFSFHNISLNDKIKDYMISDANIFFEWEGVKLQMIAEELFDFSQILSNSDVEKYHSENN